MDHMIKALSFAVLMATGGVFAANHNIDDLSVLLTTFYKVGDTLTLPAGTYTVLGDAVSTVAGNVVTCKKAGFTLINDGMTNYRLCVVPEPTGGGDVFYWYNNTGNGQNWTSVAWTKVTSNSERAYPNGEHDIAMVEGGCDWAKMYINDAISLHGYVVGVPKVSSGSGWVQLATANGKTLTFCGTESDPAFFHLTSMYTGNSQIRIGTEKGTGNDILNINVAAKQMNFDFCGDSAAVTSPYRGQGNVYVCSCIWTVPAGNTLSIVNDSKKVTDSIYMGQTVWGHFSGSGKLEFCHRGLFSASLLNFTGDAFAGDVVASAGDWKGMVELPKSTLTIVGAPNAGRSSVAAGYDNCNSNPGRSQIDAKSVTLDGGFLKIYRNYSENSAWTSGATSEEEIFNRRTVTNEIKKLILKGDSAMLCDATYNDGNGRVRQYVYLDEIDRTDMPSTLLFYDFNFRDKTVRTAATSDRVRGAGLAKWAVGKDPEVGDSVHVYKTIPWIAVTVNDNGVAVYHQWGSQMGFPKLVDGVLYSNGRTSRFLNQVVSPYENVFFSGKGVGISTNTTINTFSYSTGETPSYPSNLVLGNGKTLTIASGGMIFCCNGKWFGATQTSYFDKNGTVEFGGEHAYLFSDYGVATTGSDEWNVMWAPMVATNGLVKAGCGELVIAADQRGVDKAIWVNGGTLWLGHPANYRQLGWLYSQQATSSDTIPVRGCVTDVEEINIHAGGVLAIPVKGYDVNSDSSIGEDETAISRGATVKLNDNLAGTAKLEIAAGADQTCKKLYINGGKPVAAGTYGATGSGAANIDDAHFVGAGTLTVLGAPASGLVILVR